jgi:carbamoyltransferase
VTRELFQYDPVIGFRFIADLKTRVPHEGGGYLLRTNSQGFRSDRQFVAEKSPVKTRVLVFGDSYTAGDGVSNGCRYPDLLEKDSDAFEVYNYGLPGTGTDQHYLTWLHFARDIAADVVVIAVQVENIRRVAARYREFVDAEGKKYLYAKPWFELTSHGSLELHGVPVPPERLTESSLPAGELKKADRGGDWALVRKAIRTIAPAAKEMIQRATKPDPLPAYQSPDNSEWQLLRAILLHWIAQITQSVILMPLPLYHFIEEFADAVPYQARFAELARDARNANGKTIVLHDPLPGILTLPLAQRRNFRFEHDPHPTTDAHAFYAQSLATRLH